MRMGKVVSLSSPVPSVANAVSCLLRRWRAAIVGSLAMGVTLSLSGMALAGTPQGSHGAGARQQARNAYLRTHSNAASIAPPTNNHTPDDGDLADQFAQYNAERTA